MDRYPIKPSGTLAPIRRKPAVEIIEYIPIDRAGKGFHIIGHVAFVDHLAGYTIAGARHVRFKDFDAVLMPCYSYFDQKTFPIVRVDRKKMDYITLAVMKFLNIRKQLKINFLPNTKLLERLKTYEQSRPIRTD